MAMPSILSGIEPIELITTGPRRSKVSSVGVGRPSFMTLRTKRMPTRRSPSTIASVGEHSGSILNPYFSCALATMRARPASTLARRLSSASSGISISVMSSTRRR